MDSTEMINYKVATLAYQIPVINTSFIATISTDEFDSVTNLLESTPNEALKHKAIEFFVSSGSFASACSNGINILIPHAKYISDRDLEELFKGVHENSQWSINQILSAGGIGEVFSILYKKTKGNVISHSQMWIDFVNSLNEKNFKYDELNSLLVEDGLLEAEGENEPEQQEDEV